MKRSYNDSYYIYNHKVCSKTQKTAEIIKKYGFVPSGSDYPRAESPVGREFARQQLRRAQLAEMRKKARSDYEKRNRHQRASGSYSGRPVGVGAAAIAMEEQRNPVKDMFQRGVTAFESLREKYRGSEEFARRKASFARKWSRYRHVFLTLLAIVAILALFVMAIYRLVFVVRSIDVRSAGIYGDSEIVEASGIKEGTLLYSFSTSSAEADITFRCPYIKSASVNRTIPDKIEVVVDEDEAAYVANIWGDWAVLSKNLRVLDVSDDFPEGRGLVLLTLPQVKYSVAGRAMEFYDPKDERYVREVLRSLDSSSMSGGEKVRALYLSDRYNITMDYSDLYRVEFGDDADMSMKLEMCYAALSSGKLTPGVSARIVIEDPETASVRYDLTTALSSN